MRPLSEPQLEVEIAAARKDVKALRALIESVARGSRLRARMGDAWADAMGKTYSERLDGATARLTVLLGKLAELQEAREDSPP